ncbi:hypothetical protein [Adonisia turfae]|uniref:Uncharacterized protein n=1 Tax=Adonisia turfae CCMR0081 TaxID=2292702 RepID=A0A6M0RGD7_9CYAN|nr:hypothetical protein [Adonisia turfae]NEZ54691.1 hypothetical protein [Adonisia turfae CCMR0081]
MQTGYTQLDAEEREAVRTNGAITGQMLTTAARLTRQALDRGLQWFQNRTRPPTELELTRSQQQAADIIAVTTERCGELQGDGNLAFETEQYRFSVTPDGIYSAVDKSLDWTVFEFQRDRTAVQEKAAALADLAADYGEYTPDAAAAATNGAVDDLFTVIDAPSLDIDHSVPTSPIVATPTAQPVVEDITPTVVSSQATPISTAELTETTEETDQVPAADTAPTPGDNNNSQTMAAFFADLVDTQGQMTETNEALQVETAPAEVIPSEEPSQTIDDPWAEPTPAEPMAEIADELIESYGEPIQPKPPKRYAGEDFDILQNDNRYEVRDKDNQTLFSFEKHGNQYHILQDNLSDEQRQQFARVHTRTQSVGLDQVMADPTGNTQLRYLEDLAPEGSKAISFAHHQLGLAHTNQLATQSQGIIRHEDRSLVIYNKADNRVVASSTAQGEISSQMTPQEKATFDRAWQQTTQQQQTMPQPSRSPDLER